MFLRSLNIVLLSLTFILLTTLCETEEIEEDKPKEVIYSNSIRALSELREIENSYLEHLASYVSSLSKKVENLRTFIDSVTGRNLNSKTDPIQYVSNPLNSFGLVRRSHEDWPKFIAYTKIFENLTVENEELQKLVNRTPSADDMREALLGMHRIEHFYDLKSSDMANGLLAGELLGTRMTVPDCVALADFMYNQSEFRRSAEWYRLALSALNELQNSTAIPFHIPNPDDLRKKFIMSRLQEGSINNLSDYLMELTQDREIPLIHLRPNPTPTAIERGCRGEFPPGPQLVCRYNSTTTPFMRIAPLKEEEISRNPMIWLYHDVIYDSEIAQLTNMTRKEMTQGTTNNYTTSGQVSRLFHVKVTDDDGGKLDKTLVNRMADISGLDVGNSTSLARINYGLGSYFPEHSDYVDIKNHPEFTEEGDRLMTFLFYLTDVPVGGSTIFPAAELAIQPKKGSALFWYNLHNDGEPNPLTRHAVCPMIMGNRWVLVKSMLNYEQMFTKPCYK